MKPRLFRVVDTQTQIDAVAFQIRDELRKNIDMN